MIDINGLSLQQGQFRLEIDQLSIRPGQLVAIMGNNGSGKSTFLSALAGIIPFSGQLKIKGSDFAELPKLEQYQQISLLPQQATLNMPFDVNYVVLTGRFPHVTGNSYSESDQEHTDRILDEFDLMKFKNRQFNQLSGGEKQRVLLARILNRESDIILLDEPLASVDMQHQFELLEILKKRVAEKIIMVVVHDLHIALQAFDRFVFFDKGLLAYDRVRSDLDSDKLSEIFKVRIKINEIGGKQVIQVEQ